MNASHTITPEELTLCLEAIRKHPKAAGEGIGSPEEIYCTVGNRARYIYVNFLKAMNLPNGTIYRTWVIEFTGGRVIQVITYLSRRGAGSDETLPDDEY